MFKVSNGLLGQLVSEGFHFGENHHNLIHQSGTKFKVDQVNTETYGKQFAPYQGPKTWNFIRQEKKALQLWQHSKLRSNAGNLSVHVGFAEFLYNV